MNELINAIEAAVRKIIQEEIGKAISDQLSEGNFDSVVRSAIDNNLYVISSIEQIIEKNMEDHDFHDQIITAVKDLTYEVTVSR